MMTYAPQRAVPLWRPLHRNYGTLVSQCRLLYNFSQGYALTGNKLYVEAVEKGARFLLEHFRDKRHGGWYWSCNLDGETRDRRKDGYGHAFTLFGLAHSYACTGNPALREAMFHTWEVMTNHFRGEQGGFRWHMSESFEVIEHVSALEKLKEQGKIRAIGVCNFGVQDTTEILQLYPIATNQLPYSLLWRVIEREILPVCLANDVGLMCYSPLAQGLLTGRYASADEVPPGIARTRYYASHRADGSHGEAGCEEEVFAALATIKEIAANLGQSMAAVALAWLRQQPGVTSILVGARTPEEVALNLPALNLQLPNDVVNALVAATEPVKEKLGNNPDMWMVPSRMR